MMALVRYSESSDDVNDDDDDDDGNNNNNNNNNNKDLKIPELCIFTDCPNPCNDTF